MRVPFVNLWPAIANEFGDLWRAQQRAVRNTRFLDGEEVAGFEAAFGRMVGAPHVVATGSGTDALAIALRACGISDGEAVLTPAFGCPATVAAIHQAGGQPVFCDVGSDGLAGAEQFRDALESPEKAVAAVLPVHLFGRLVDVAAIRALTAATDRPLARKPPIVEDAAQAVGLVGVGRHSDAVAHSFYPTKNLGAWGDAGAVTTGDTTTAGICKSLRQYGVGGYVKGQSTWACSAEWGWCSRMDEQQAAVLTHKMRLLDRWRRQRERAWSVYAEHLPEGVFPWAAEGAEVAWNHHLVPVLVADRDRVREAMARRGVSTGVHYPVPLPMLGPYGISREHAVVRFPNALRWADEELSLPMYPGLRDEEVRYVCRALQEAMAEAREPVTA